MFNKIEKTTNSYPSLSLTCGNKPRGLKCEKVRLSNFSQILSTIFMPDIARNFVKSVVEVLPSRGHTHYLHDSFNIKATFPFAHGGGYFTTFSQGSAPKTVLFKL